MVFFFFRAGQITLNGQVVPGLNVNNVTGLPQATATTSSRGTTPTPTSQADNSTYSFSSVVGKGIQEVVTPNESFSSEMQESTGL